MIRLFAAIAVPEGLARSLAPLQHGVDGARWRPPEALHITLRFFGDIAENVAEDLHDALQAIEGGPFTLDLAGVGAFGEGRNLPRHLGGRGRQRAAAAAGRTLRESAARRVGIRPETRNYAPHVTLAYLRGADAPGEVAAWIQRHNLYRGGPLEAASFGTLFELAGAGGVPALPAGKRVSAGLT